MISNNFFYPLLQIDEISAFLDFIFCKKSLFYLVITLFRSNKINLNKYLFQ